MTYNPNTPQPTEIPSQSQTRFLTNFTLFSQYFGQDHIPPGNVITLATNTAPIVITSAGHGLSTGNMVTVYDITGIEGNTPVAWPINGNTFTITVIDVNTFSLQGSDATGYPAYLTGTGNFSSASYLYGYHKQLTAAGPLAADPIAAIPGGAIYSKNFIPPNMEPSFPNPDLFFNNMASIVQLTRLFNNATSSTQGGTRWSFVTPWGVIVNMGFLNSGGTGSRNTNFSLPYTTTNFGVVLTSSNPKTSGQVVVKSTTLIGFEFGTRDPNVNVYFLSMGI